MYLPAYSDKRIIDVLSELDDIKWQVFSKHSKKTYREKNVFIRPIENDLFIESLISCTGILCGAGFETPAEALYLKKKLLVIPMKGQYEQQCNAAALEILGVPVLKSLKNKHLEKIKSWTQNPQEIPVLYPDITEKIIDMVIRENIKPDIKPAGSSDTEILTVKALKAKSLERILKQSAD